MTGARRPEHRKQATAAFELSTRWHLAAPIQRVWDAIHAVERWPQWWPYVASVVELEPGDASGLGAVHRFCWKTRLPYRIDFDSTTTRVEPPDLLEASIVGEVTGVGRWELSEAENETQVLHLWAVDVRRPWMRHLTPILRPVFAWNHREVMRIGGDALAKHLARV